MTQPRVRANVNCSCADHKEETRGLGDQKRAMRRVGTGPGYQTERDVKTATEVRVCKGV
jgi:hypothetical protein